MKSNFFLLALILFSSTSFAQEVSQVKGEKALLKLDGASFSSGDEVYTLDADGKRRGLVKITQVKGDKALSEIIKGRVESGMTLKLKSGGGSQSDAAPSSDDHSKRSKGFFSFLAKPGTALGFLGGIAQNSMSLTAKKGSTSEDLSMAGSSFNIVGFYDYDLSKQFTVRTKLGLENFDAAATAQNPTVCSDSTSCSVGFTYLSAEASGHFNFVRGKTRAWAGAGFAFLMAATKKTTVSNLDTSSATNQMILLGGGADIGMGGGAFIPVSFEYGLFPGSSSVKASSLLLKAGYAWRY